MTHKNKACIDDKSETRSRMIITILNNCLENYCYGKFSWDKRQTVHEIFESIHEIRESIYEIIVSMWLETVYEIRKCSRDKS